MGGATALQGGVLRDLAYMAQFLHGEGFYAAESALLREIEERFPDHAGPPRRGGSPASPSSLPLPGPGAEGAAAEAEAQQQPREEQEQGQEEQPEPGTVDLQAAAASTGLRPVDSTDSVERYVPGSGCCLPAALACPGGGARCRFRGGA